MRRYLLVLFIMSVGVGLVTVGAAALVEQRDISRARTVLEQLTLRESQQSYSGLATLKLRWAAKGVDLRLRLSSAGTDRALEVVSLDTQGIRPQDVPGLAFLEKKLTETRDDSAAGAKNRALFRRLGADLLAWQYRIHNSELLFRNYDVRLMSREWVAGRPTDRLRIAPRRAGRPVRTLWVDVERSFLLAAETELSECGMRAELRFDEVTFDPVFPEGTFAEIKPGASALSGLPGLGSFVRANLPIDSVRKEVKFPLLMPSVLPAGFSLQETAVLRFGGGAALHSVYSDGLVTISLFQYDLNQFPLLKLLQPKKEKPVAATPVIERRRIGPATLLQLDLGETQALMVGSIDSDELVEMLSSLETRPVAGK